MDLIKIIIDDFLCYQHVEVDCTQFESVLIVGKSNNDERFSNGSGKSAFFKAIEYGLFGYFNKNIDRIVRWNQTVAKVIIQFLLDDNIYQVTRSRNRKTSKSDLILEQISPIIKNLTQKTNSETEQELSKLIKVSHSTFRNSTIFVQDDLQHLAGLKSATDKKNVLKEALNLVIYSKLEKMAKEELQPLIKDLSNLREQIKSLGNPKVTALQASQAIETGQNCLEQYKIKQTELISQQADLNLKLTEIQHKLGANLLNLKQNHQDTLNQINQIKFDLKKLDTAPNQELLRKYQESLDSKQKELTLLKEIPKSNLDASKIEQDLIVIKHKLNELTLELGANLGQLQVKISLPDSNICDVCQQPITQQHRHQVQLNNKDKEEQLVNENKDIAKKQEALRSEYEKLNQDIKNHQKYLIVKNNIVQLESDIKQKQDTIVSLTDSISSILSQKQDKLASKSKLEAKLDSLQKELDQVNLVQLEQTKFDLNNQLSDIKLSIDNINKNISDQEIGIALTQDKLARSQETIKTLEELQIKESSLDAEIKTLQIVIAGFGPSGIPAMIIYTILDDLQKNSNEIMQILRPQIEIQFSVIKDKPDGSQEDTFEISYRLHGNDIDWDELSGGQKFMVALSLRLGMSKLLQDRLGIRLKFLQLDEIDEKLDQAGIDDLIKLIRSLQSKYKIFIITHREQMKDNFSHILCINYHPNNGTTATLESI